MTAAAVAAAAAAAAAAAVMVVRVVLVVVVVAARPTSSGDWSDPLLLPRRWRALRWSSSCVGLPRALIATARSR